MENAAYASAVSCKPRKRHGIRFYRRILGLPRPRHISLRLLWNGLVRLEYQIRFRHRLAFILAAHRPDQHSGRERSQLFHAQDRSVVRSLRCASWAMYSRMARRLPDCATASILRPSSSIAAPLIRGLTVNNVKVKWDTVHCASVVGIPGARAATAGITCSKPVLSVDRH